MAMPTWQDIGTYMSITGASESLALQKLQEHDGNLVLAVDSFYRGEEDHMLSATNPPPNGYLEEPQRNVVHSASNNKRQSGPGLSPILSAARSFKPSLLFDPNYRRDLITRISAVGSSLLSPQGQGSSAPAQPISGLVPPIHFEHMPTVENQHNPAGYNVSNIDSHVVDDEVLQSVIRDSMLDIEAIPDTGHSARQFHQEDDDLARALAFSLETSEKEEAFRDQQMRVHKPALVIDRRSKPGCSSSQNESQKEEEEQQLRGKSIHIATNHLYPNEEEASHLREWGVTSAEELNEALMLENALLGSNSAGPSNNSASTSPLESDPRPLLRPLSPLHQESQLLKEQQGKEKQVSLLLDKQKQEDSHRKMLDEADQKTSLAAKKAQLLSEPASDDENAVSLDFRMPNGSRTGRRFLKSDKLQILYDFVDMGVSGEVKPGTYRVVRPYPRRVFNLNESSLTLSELGLTNKQELLWLELI